MQNPDDSQSEVQALRERLSRLSEASLRVTEDLDLDTVLQRVVDGACALTGARIGGITVLDQEGGLQGFITSGLSPEERRLFVELPGGPQFFRLPEPAAGTAAAGRLLGLYHGAGTARDRPAPGSGGQLPWGRPSG